MTYVHGWHCRYCDYIGASANNDPTIWSHTCWPLSAHIRKVRENGPRLGDDKIMMNPMWPENWSPTTPTDWQTENPRP